MSMSYITATVSFSKPRPTEISLTYGYQILWTGADYEVTVMSEPNEAGHVDYIVRTNHRIVSDCLDYVKRVLERDVLLAARDMVVFKEETV